MEDYITLKEWAEREGIHPDNARQKALRGTLKTAKKMGVQWIIHKDEKNQDNRFKNKLES